MTLIPVIAHGSGQTWLPGQIQEIRGPVSYTVVVSDGHSFKRHVDHLRKRTVADVTDDPPENNRDDCLPPPNSVNDSNSALPDAPPLQPSSRIRHPPDHYTPENIHQ